LGGSGSGGSLSSLLGSGGFSGGSSGGSGGSSFGSGGGFGSGGHFSRHRHSCYIEWHDSASLISGWVKPVPRRLCKQQSVTLSVSATNACFLQADILTIDGASNTPILLPSCHASIDPLDTNVM
jgi:hypothetical protein